MTELEVLEDYGRSESFLGTDQLEIRKVARRQGSGSLRGKGRTDAGQSKLARSEASA